VVEVDVGLSGLAVLHHTEQRASLQTQLPTSAVDMAQYPLPATVAQHLVGAISGDALRAAVPVRDAPVQGDEVDPIGDLVEQVLVELLVRDSSAVRRCWALRPGGTFIVLVVEL